MTAWFSTTTEESGDEKKADSVLSVMMHSIESSKPLTDFDKDRLNHLCWDIEFSKEPINKSTTNASRATAMEPTKISEELFVLMPR